jgi:hypothetical protein
MMRDRKGREVRKGDMVMLNTGEIGNTVSEPRKMFDGKVNFWYVMIKIGNYSRDSYSGEFIRLPRKRKKLEQELTIYKLEGKL